MSAAGTRPVGPGRQPGSGPRPELGSHPELAGLLGPGRTWFCDLDGTLVDSAPVHAAAFHAALAALAPDLLAGFDYAEHAGAGTREAMLTLGATGDLVDHLVRHKQRTYREHVHAGRVATCPGAHRLLDLLAHTGTPAYLVTSGSRESVRRVLAGCALDGYFRDVLTADDLPVTKPDPAVYREACRRWAVEPARAVVLEDSTHGVQAAVGAGLTTVQVHAARPEPDAIAVPDLDRLVALLGAGGRTDRVVRSTPSSADPRGA